MSFFNTGNPVPSNDPRDLDDNAMHVDELVNSTELNFTDRLGTERLTLAGIEAEAASSATLRSDLAADDGSDLVGFIAAGDGAEAMTLQDKGRLSDLTVIEFMTDAERADALSGTPLLSHSGAFADFLAAVKIRGGRGTIPKYGAYRLDTNVLGDWSQVIEYEEGAVLTGSGILFAVQHVINKPIASRDIRRGTAEVASQTVGTYTQITSEGSAPNYGTRFDFRQTGTLTSGFGIGLGNISVFDSISGAAGMAEWTVCESPLEAAGGTWGVVVKEMNIMNRGPDTGYVKTRGESQRWTGGLQIVPESLDLASPGAPGNCRNTVFGFCTAHSVHPNDLGFTVKTYNGFLVEKDSIAPAGRGSLLSGDTTGNLGERPFAAIEIDQRWTVGIEFEAATFTNNVALALGAAHKLVWGSLGTSISSVSGNIRLDSAVSTNVDILPGGLLAARFAYVANAVNFLNMFGNAAGSAPNVGAAGTDTNIDIKFTPKGTGVLDYVKAAVAATTPANFTATHMVDIKFNGVAYKIPARVAAW